MDIHATYDLRHVINACGKMTKLAGAIVLPEIADTVRESLDHFFELDALQEAAVRAISEVGGVEEAHTDAEEALLQDLLPVFRALPSSQ